MVAATLFTFVLASCGAEPADDQPEPPATPQVLTDQQLAAAMPGVDDVAVASSVEAECPEEIEDCLSADGAEAHVSVAMMLKPSADDAAQAEAEADQASNDVPESMRLSAYRFASVEQARAFVSPPESRGDLEPSFSTEAVETGESTYTPGLKGTATEEAVEIGQFEGQVTARKLSLVDPDGDAGTPFVDAIVSASNGTTVISCSANTWLQYRDADAPQKLCEQLIGEYVERLSQRSE